MRTRILMALVAVVLCGCATGRNGGSGGSGAPPEAPWVVTEIYEGHPAIEGPVRQELARQCELVGYATNRAWTVHITGNRIEPSGRNDDGWYGPLDGGSSVHGAYLGQQGEMAFTMWFAFPVDGEPDLSTVSHECVHDLGVYHQGIGGHPLTMVLNGSEWRVHDIMIAGARWPMRVWQAIKRVATPWRPHGFSDRVNGVDYPEAEWGGE